VQYELSIRLKSSEGPGSERLVAGLRALAPQPAPAEGAQAPATTGLAPEGGWRIPCGRGKEVRVRPVLETDRLRGVDAELPLDVTEADAEKIVDALFSLAEESDAVLGDPQLGREVGKSQKEDVLERWRQSQTWAADIMGAVSLTGPVEAPTESSSQGRILWVVLGLGITFFLVLRLLTFLAR